MDETLPLAHENVMQFGHALDRLLLREILLANPNKCLYGIIKS